MDNLEDEAERNSSALKSNPSAVNGENKGVQEKKLSTDSTEPIMDVKSDGQTLVKEPNDTQSISKVMVASNSDENFLSVDLCEPSNIEANNAKVNDENLTKTGDVKPKLQHTNSSQDAEDFLLNPHVYEKYEQSIDITEDFTDILIKQFDNVKDFARDKTVFSLSLGERGIIWTYKKIRVLSKMWFTYVFLFLLLLAYSIIGAVIFILLEGTYTYETSLDSKLNEIRMEMAVKLKNIVINETIIHKNNEDFFKMIENDLKAYEDNYTECMKHINNNAIANSWTFWNAMIFAGTIYTTIGYGHITPKTTAGRVVTMIYAVIGIPLFLIVLASYGKLLTRTIKYIWAYILNFRNRRKQTSKKVTRNDQKIAGSQDNVEVNNPPAISEFKVDDEFNLPVIFAIFILILYMVVGAAVVVYLETWSFFESFYFIFISMSTIGLGDIVSNHPIFINISILYAIFGLSLTSMCINVVQNKISGALTKYEHVLVKVEEASVIQSEKEVVKIINEQNEMNAKETHDR